MFIVYNSKRLGQLMFVNNERVKLEFIRQEQIVKKCTVWVGNLVLLLY